MEYQILQGDVIEKLRTLPDEYVNCVVTSPPYWGLRDYGSDGQIGLESTPEEFIERLVSVFSEVRRVLRNDGTIWVNMGDTYAGGGKGGGGSYGNERRGFSAVPSGRVGTRGGRTGDGDIRNGGGEQQGVLDSNLNTAGVDNVRVCKPKDLVGVPWMLAFALRADGWYLRQDIIWAKPNPMPESVRDRCTKSHEYIFLLSKSARYYYDADSVSQPAAPSSIARLSQPTLETQEGSDRVPGKTNGPMKAVFGGRNKHEGYGTRLHSGREDQGNYIQNGVNKRSVWTVATQPYKGAHFATFPTKLIEPCVLAGCPKGGTVLDPFSGSGTTGVVSLSNERNYIGIELNPEYVELSHTRIQKAVPLFITQSIQKMDELEEVAS